MSVTPLTHHQILSVVEPFSRVSHHVDLAASDRLARKLVFKTVELDPPCWPCRVGTAPGWSAKVNTGPWMALHYLPTCRPADCAAGLWLQPAGAAPFRDPTAAAQVQGRGLG